MVAREPVRTTWLSPVENGTTAKGKPSNFCIGVNCVMHLFASSLAFRWPGFIFQTTAERRVAAFGHRHAGTDFAENFGIQLIEHYKSTLKTEAIGVHRAPGLCGVAVQMRTFITAFDLFAVQSRPHGVVVQLVSRHSCVADRLPVAVRFPAGPQATLKKTVDPPGLGQKKLFSLQ